MTYQLAKQLKGDYTPTKEEIELVAEIRRRYSEWQRWKKLNPHFCFCWACQVGEFVYAKKSASLKRE